MYRTLAWPPEATLRAIWSAIVVLPVPWAPPISSSSPARRPRPIVLSSGVKPSGTGWYSRTWPVVTLSLRSTSTSSAERGFRLPLAVSRPHDDTDEVVEVGAAASAACGASAVLRASAVVVASGASVLTRLDPPGWLRRRIVAPAFVPDTHPNVPFPHRPERQRQRGRSTSSSNTRAIARMLVS